MFGRFLLPLLLATGTIAASFHRRDTCSVPATALSLSPPFPPLSSPPHLVALGVGFQNYTCSSSGNYTSIGAVANMFNINCVYGTAEFDKIQNDIYDKWQTCDTLPLDPDLGEEFHYEFNIPLVGFHYFISDNGTLRPEFDFTSAGPTKGNADAFVIATKTVDVPAPDSHHDIDWLELTRTSGGYADKVYRVDTKGGQPPTSCTPGSGPITVPYVAKYWFEGGSF